MSSANEIQSPEKLERDASSAEESKTETTVPQNNESEKPQAPVFPEGGFWGWSTVLGAWLVQFCTFGYVNAYGVYNDFYVREYLNNSTSSEVGWIGSVQVLALFSLGLFSGRLFDKGYFHHLMIIGSLLFGFSLFMLSLTHEHQYYQVFLSHGLGSGIGSGLTYIPSLGIVAHYFQRRRALAMGIVASGSSLGAVIHPIMLNKLFHGSVGFHNGVRASAGMNLGLLIIANLLMRTRLPPRKVAPIPFKQYARDAPYVFAVSAGFMVILALYFPIFFLQLDADTHNVDANLAFYSLAILNAASFVGRILPNFLVPYFGVFNLIVPCTLIIGILIFCMLAVTNAGGVIAFAIFFGFFSGAVISLGPPMLALLANNLYEMGSRIGIFFTVGGLAGFVGIPIAGALLSSHFTWWRPIVFAGVVTIAGALFYGIARYYVAKRKGTQKV